MRKTQTAEKEKPGPDLDCDGCKARLKKEISKCIMGSVQVISVNKIIDTMPLTEAKDD